jgi:predicted lipid-binding transport protein (Tim44 family)
MSGNNDLILTLIFLGVAVFVILKLRAVLGTKTGFERPPEAIQREIEERRNAAQNASAQDSSRQDNVVPMPGVARPGMPAQPEMDQADRWKGIAVAGTPLASGLDAVVAADPSFDPRGFVGGARGAYEMIVMAFAKGDRKTLKDFLAKDVYEGFASVITDRESRSETAETTFVSIDKANVVGAEMRDRMAHITVSFASKLISATRDKTGIVIEGSMEKISDVDDVWTFTRDVTARDPNWKLVATESNG